MSHHVRYVAPVRYSVGGCPECGKQRYVSKSAAKKAARWKQTFGDAPECRPYRCGDYWHLTSADRSRLARWREWEHERAAADAG
jgi:hypothetical protein